MGRPRADAYPYGSPVARPPTRAARCGARVTSQGRVTIPVEIRERFGLLPDTEVEFVVDGGEVKIVPAAPSRPGRGSRVVDRLRGSATVRMTTEEIMKLTRGPA